MVFQAMEDLMTDGASLQTRCRGLQKEERGIDFGVLDDRFNMMSSVPSASDSLPQVLFTSLPIFGMYRFIFSIGPSHAHRLRITDSYEAAIRLAKKAAG